MLSLSLHHPEKYYYRLPKSELLLRKLNGQKDKKDLRTRFTDLDKSIDDAWEFIDNKVFEQREKKIFI